MAEPEYKNLPALLAALDAQGVEGAERYQAVKSYLGFKARDKAIPISGSFELTPLCNLDCKMCYVHLQKEQLRGARLLTVEQWKRLMDQAIDAGMLFAGLTGGECLTYPGFKELYLYLRGRGVEPAVLTNGSLIDDEMAAFFAAHPPAVVQITLYGSDEDAYERVTGQRMFGRVVAAIRRLKAVGIPLRLAMTPNRYMGQDGPRLLEVMESLDVPYSINAGLMEPRTETGRAAAAHDTAAAEYVDLYRRQWTHRGLADKISPYLGALPPPGGQGEQPPGIRCGAGRSTFAIGWTGAMRPCNTLEACLAAPLETGFAAAWKKINAWANSYRYPSACVGCAYAALCPRCAAVLQHPAGGTCASPALLAQAQALLRAGLRRPPEDFCE